jgi:hypothetical protein
MGIFLIYSDPAGMASSMWLHYSVSSTNPEGTTLVRSKNAEFHLNPLKTCGNAEHERAHSCFRDTSALVNTLNPQHSRIHSRNRDLQFLYPFYIRDTLVSHVHEFFRVRFSFFSFEHFKEQRSEESLQLCYFQASKGWFNKFKNRHSLHNVKLVGKSASANHEAAQRFPEKLRKLIEKGYVPQQIFNADETGLFWKNNA